MGEIGVYLDVNDNRQCVDCRVAETSFVSTNNGVFL